MPSWAYVELKCSGGTTAPVRGSKAWPAWTARVLNPWFSETDMELLGLVAEVCQEVVAGQDADGGANEGHHHGVDVGQELTGSRDGLQRADHREPLPHVLGDLVRQLRLAA